MKTEDFQATYMWIEMLTGAVMHVAVREILPRQQIVSAHLPFSQGSIVNNFSSLDRLCFVGGTLKT